MKIFIILLFFFSTNLYGEIIKCNYNIVGSEDRVHINEDFDTKFLAGRLVYERNSEIDLINLTFFRSKDDIFYLRDIKFLDNSFFPLSEIINMVDHNVITKILLHMWVSRKNRNAETLDDIINKLYDKNFTFLKFKKLVALNHQDYFTSNFIYENLYEHAFNEVKKLKKENMKERLNKLINMSESELEYKNVSIDGLKFLLQELNNFANTNENILIFDQKRNSLPQYPDHKGFVEYFTNMKGIVINEKSNNEFEIETTEDNGTSKAVVVFNNFNNITQSRFYLESSYPISKGQQTWINILQFDGECN